MPKRPPVPAATGDLSARGSGGPSGDGDLGDEALGGGREVDLPVAAEGHEPGVGAGDAHAALLELMQGEQAILEALAYFGWGVHAVGAADGNHAKGFDHNGCL